MTWLEFVEQPQGKKKTKTWAVVAVKDNYVLGYVKWYAPWRQYTFTNWNGRYGIVSVWNPDCLDEVSEFIREQMSLRKAK